MEPDTITNVERTLGLKIKKKSTCLAYLIGCLANGGQEKQLLHLLRALSPEKTIFLFVWNFKETDKNYLSFKALDINIIPLSKKSFFQKVKNIRTVLKKEKPLVLHSFTFYLNFMAFLSTVFLSTRGIGGLRSSIKEELKLSPLRTSLDLFLPYHIISNNYSSLEFLKKHWLFKFKKSLHVIPNKLDVQKFDLSSSPSDEIQTRSIGRIDDNKRIDLIIGLIDNLKNKGINITHKHAGEGDLKSHLQKDVIDKGLEKNFIFSGNTSDINSFLSNTSFFIHAANTEGSPNVVMEAMACGKAILTTNCGDVSVYVRNNINGFVTEAGNLDALITKGLDLISNPELTRKMGQESRIFAEQNFKIVNLKVETLKCTTILFNYYEKDYLFQPYVRLFTFFLLT